MYDALVEFGVKALDRETYTVVMLRLFQMVIFICQIRFITTALHDHSE